MTTFTEQDHFFMTMARGLAKRSLARGEVPVGAVVVDAQGVVIGRGYNLMEAKGTQQAHAEMRALSAAAKKRGGWRLDECTLYITLEPCVQCLGCATLSRVSRIVYGAPSPQFGAVESFAKLPEIYRVHTTIARGLQQLKCGDMLKSFFSEIRAKIKDSP